MVHSVLQTLRIETAVLFELLLQLILGRCPDDYDGSVGGENNGESAHAQINGGRRFGSKARSSVSQNLRTEQQTKLSDDAERVCWGTFRLLLEIGIVWLVGGDGGGGAHKN